MSVKQLREEAAAEQVDQPDEDGGGRSLAKVPLG